MPQELAGNAQCPNIILLSPHVTMHRQKEKVKAHATIATCTCTFQNQYHIALWSLGRDTCRACGGLVHNLITATSEVVQCGSHMKRVGATDHMSHWLHMPLNSALCIAT